MTGIRERLYKEIFNELPKLAKQQNWAVTEDHCIAMIVYDSVVGCKWSEKVKSPFYKNAELSKVEEALVVCDRLKKEGKELADRLNEESLGWRKKLH